MMPRELRPRKSRPSYAALYAFDDDDDEAAGPSKQNIVEEEDSGSDFAVEAAGSAEENDEQSLSSLTDVEDEKDEVSDDEGDDDIAFSTKRTIQSKARSGSLGQAESRRRGVQFAPGLSRPGNRQMHALPLPSPQHRHRSVPIYHRHGRVERVMAKPRLFQPIPTSAVSSGTSELRVVERLSKAWGFNVGPGPLWELLEDRGWFKEAIRDQGDEHEDAHRRPTAHKDVSVKGFGVVDMTDASSYLPSGGDASEGSRSQPPKPLKCSFGPFERQTPVELDRFQSLNLATVFPSSRSHVFNAGAPVWALDWCPIHASDRSAISHKQYLAVASFPSRNHNPEIGLKVPRPSPACVQIWSLAPRTGARADTQGDEGGEMVCEMVLCLDCGPAHDLKWCPLPAHDELSAQRAEEQAPRKLGILAGTFQDGSLSVFVVPYPEDVASTSHATHGPVSVKLSEPLIRVELDETACWTLDWANSEVIAVGCTNGSIAVYNIATALRSPEDPILPTHYFSVHQSAVHAIAWITAPPGDIEGEPDLDADPTVIASGGYDGVECLTDIREPGGNVMNRTRDVIHAIAYSPYAGGPVIIDHENIIKVYSLAPTMLGRGHTLLEPSGPTWSISASAYHPQIAVGCADGTCLTTNTSRSTRRGGSVPFLEHRIFQLDFSRKTGEFRMLERFLPQETHDRPGAMRAQKKNASVEVPPVGTGAWPPEVSVTRVSWNDKNGPGAAGWLASATASGLCRVDWLEGRWMRDRVPFGGVDAMRGAEACDEDDEDE